MEFKMHSWSPEAPWQQGNLQEWCASKGCGCFPSYYQLIPWWCREWGLLSETWISAGLDGASAFVEPPGGAEAVQAGGHWADAWVMLLAVHAAVRVQKVRKSLPLLHVCVQRGVVMWNDHGDGVLQLLSVLVPKAGAHGLKVEHFSVNVAQAAARCPSFASTNCAHPDPSGWCGGRGRRVWWTVDVSACLTVVSQQCPLLSVPLLVLSVHRHEAQHC